MTGRSSSAQAMWQLHKSHLDSPPPCRRCPAAQAVRCNWTSRRHPRARAQSGGGNPAGPGSPGKQHAPSNKAPHLSRTHSATARCDTLASIQDYPLLSIPLLPIRSAWLQCFSGYITRATIEQDAPTSLSAGFLCHDEPGVAAGGGSLLGVRRPKSRPEAPRSAQAPAASPGCSSRSLHGGKMWLGACVCVRVRACACVCVRVRACACVCVRVRACVGGSSGWCHVAPILRASLKGT